MTRPASLQISTAYPGRKASSPAHVLCPPDALDGVPTDRARGCQSICSRRSKTGSERRASRTRTLGRSAAATILTQDAVSSPVVQPSGAAATDRAPSLAGWLDELPLTRSASTPDVRCIRCWCFQAVSECQPGACSRLHAKAAIAVQRTIGAADLATNCCTATACSCVTEEGSSETWHSHQAMLHFWPSVQVTAQPRLKHAEQTMHKATGSKHRPHEPQHARDAMAVGNSPRASLLALGEAHALLDSVDVTRYKRAASLHAAQRQSSLTQRCET